MHPLFIAVLVVAVVLAAGSLALTLLATEPRPRRHRPATDVPPWLDLDGSARRATARRRQPERWPAAHA